MSTDYYVYCYLDPSRNNEPIYVGKGRGHRVFKHLTRKDKHPLTHRINSIRVLGQEPLIKFFVENVDEELAYFVEEELIASIGRKDLKAGPLLNLTDGGVCEKGAICSEAHKQKLSLAKIGRTFENLSTAKRGKAKPLGPQTEEHRLKISKACKGRKVSQETRDKISKARLEKSKKGHT